MTTTVQEADEFMRTKSKRRVEWNGNTFRHLLAEFADRICADRDAELARLREALEHYADEEYWDCFDRDDHECTDSCWQDQYIGAVGYQVAQNALKETEEK